MRRIFVLPLLLMCFTACKEKGNQSSLFDSIIINIDVKKQQADKDQPALSGYDYIRLETNEESVMRSLWKVEIEGDRVYVLTRFLNAGPKGSEILIFDTNGKFIKKLQKGRGPKEYIYPTDINVDRENKRLVVLDQYYTIMEYDLDGNFLDSKEIDISNCYLQSVSDGYLLYNPNASKINTTLVSHMSKKGKTRPLLNSTFKGQAYFELCSSFAPLGKDSVLVANTFSDTVYLYNAVSGSLSPHIVFDYGPKGSANENVARFQEIGEYYRNAKENNKATGPSPFTMIGDYLYFGNGAFNFALHNMSEGTTVIYDKLFADLPNYYGLLGKAEDRLVYAYEPLRLIKYFEKNPPTTDKARELASGLKEDDNPILVLGYI